MSQITRTYSFTDGTTAYGSQVESEISNIATVWNNHDSGSSSFTALSVAGATTLSGAATFPGGVGATTFTGAITATGGVVNLFGYRRPNLTYVSATAVDIENNTGTANQTTIVFPDGTVRSVTEDTSSTNKYRRFLITATAEYTTGTEDSGLYTGLAEATNTWYAIYAVKSTINTANFVLVGTTTLPIRANFSTLNTNLGANSWVYLGLIRNGDNSAATGDILSFLHSGTLTSFANTEGGGQGIGLRLTTTNTYTYSAGTGTTDIPNHIKITINSFSLSDTGGIDYTASASNAAIVRGVAAANKAYAAQFISPISLGLVSTTSSTNQWNLNGWFDPLLDGSHQIL